MSAHTEIWTVERVITCQNCWRERLERDVFWHRGDRAWYCVNVWACEYRYYIQGEQRSSNSAGKPGAAA